MKRILAMLALSVSLGVIGLWFVYRGELLRPENYRPLQLQPLLLGLVLLTFLAQLLAPVVKLSLLCRFQGVPLRLRWALLVHLAGVFGAVITPGSSGGAPAIVMALTRLGVPLGKGVGVASQVFLLDLIFFSWAGPLGLGLLIYTGTIALPVDTEILTGIAVALAVALAVVIGRYPRLGSGALLWLAGRRPLQRFSRRLGAIARDYHRSAHAYLGFSTGKYALLHLFTLLGWLGNYLLLWALLMLYGIERSPVTVTALLANISLLATFVPTPGGSGFVEAAVGLTAGGASATAPLVLWRLLTYYLFFVLGPAAAWLLFRSNPLAARARGAGRTGDGTAHR